MQWMSVTSRGLLLPSAVQTVIMTFYCTFFNIFRFRNFIETSIKWYMVMHFILSYADKDWHELCFIHLAVYYNSVAFYCIISKWYQKGWNQSQMLNNVLPTISIFQNRLLDRYPSKQFLASTECPPYPSLMFICSSFWISNLFSIQMKFHLVRLLWLPFKSDIKTISLDKGGHVIKGTLPIILHQFQSNYKSYDTFISFTAWKLFSNSVNCINFL